MKIIHYKINGNSAEVPYAEDVLERILQEADGGAFSVTEVEDESSPLSLEERVAALEKAVKPADYVAGTWYYRGDKVNFENAVYTCIAPESTVCVWSPVEYAVYWEKAE